MTNRTTRVQRLIADLKRRHVFRGAAVYGAVGPGPRARATARRRRGGCPLRVRFRPGRTGSPRAS